MRAREVMNDFAERERRIEQRISTARVAHMSNAKWRKLFAVMYAQPKPLGHVGFKFINDDRVFRETPPEPNFAHEDNFGECGGISHSLFRHLEYVEIPRQYQRNLNGPRYPATEFSNDVQRLIEELAKVGQFAIQEDDRGLRILGYEWDVVQTSR
jgi:hypothetical protein